MPDITIQVHEAGKIRGNHILRTCFQCMIYFLIRHGQGDGFKFYGKTSSKSTTGFHIFHFHQFKSFYLG